jgi:methionyl-tRNA formyltransferase
VLEREIRAYLGWPKSVARIYGQKIIVTKARVAKDQDDGALVMKCQPGYLEILELIGPSGRKMSGADFLRGYSKRR